MSQGISKTRTQEFVKNWKGRGNENQDCQKFWMELLDGVFGVPNRDMHDFISFEKPVTIDGSTKYIDAYLPDTKVLIEQKSKEKNLADPEKQSDGSELTPYQQAKRYDDNLPLVEKAKWIITCNFQTFQVYDMNMPGAAPVTIALKDLPEKASLLQFIVDAEKLKIIIEKDVSFNAGEIIGKIYDLLSAQYHDIAKKESQRDLNILCVRLVFCLYAEDAGIFEKNLFHDYLAHYDPQDLRVALKALFDVLDTKEEERDPYISDTLAKFPYTDGGLFTKKDIEIPNFTQEIKDYLVSKASGDFDWEKISPTIFGALFESTLNPETRRSGGMHYTSIENIHKVIDPLFFDELNQEYEEILSVKVPNTRNRKLKEFQNKLGSLRFLDPACGSGNFLTETYLSLRRLENKVIKELNKGQMFLSFAKEDIIKVNINQFYGIEINDFAVEVAKTALWIAESQMFKETEDIVEIASGFLPLETNAHIIEADALTADWNYIVPRDQLNYIMGNPPFVGARIMSSEQKSDLINVFGKDWKNVGNLDYVCGWYKKAADYMNGTPIRAAFVSTNSICQGEQVAALWKPLFDEGIKINYAYRTFRWDSEAKIKAHVHCVIVGFSYVENNTKALFYEDNSRVNAHHINAYLTEGPDVFIDSRSKPISDVPILLTGCQRLDNDNFMFDKRGMEEFVSKEPRSAKYFRKWYGSEEFLHNSPRYCLWLGECTPEEIQRMPLCYSIVSKVREYRLSSNRRQTVKYADMPNHFYLEVIPKNNFVIVPVVSSQRRRYIPIGFMSPDVLCSNQVNMIPDTTLYHFGVLTSSVHMDWMRVVAGRLETRYRYSKDIVYNNFPWPEPTNEQKARIEKTAQAILDARDLHPNSSMAALYDETTMPPELRKAHQDNDAAVLAAYGLSADTSDADIVTHLFMLYSQLINK
jgi:type I restriction-modification system DNA methylase subunit